MADRVFWNKCETYKTPEARRSLAIRAEEVREAEEKRRADFREKDQFPPPWGHGEIRWADGCLEDKIRFQGQDFPVFVAKGYQRSAEEFAGGERRFVYWEDLSWKAQDAYWTALGKSYTGQGGQVGLWWAVPEGAPLVRKAKADKEEAEVAAGKQWSKERAKEPASSRVSTPDSLPSAG